MFSNDYVDELQDEIADLEDKLEEAQAKVNRLEEKLGTAATDFRDIKHTVENIIKLLEEN